MIDPPDTLIPLARPSLGAAELAATERVLGSGQLVLGRENQRFENQLATLTGRSHAVCVSSGTTALELGLWALGIGPGADVLVPAGGFPAAVHAIMRLGARPILVDLDPATWTMDVTAAEAALTAETRALVSVDTFGVVAEAQPLRALCQEAGIFLVNDAACSLGGFDSNGHPGGGYGVLGTFSFHPRKVITTGEGGAVVCDNDDLAADLRALRNHGQHRRGQFARAGTNARLPEVAAAIGCAQLARLEAMVTERRLLVAGYEQRLASLYQSERLSWQMVPAGARSVHQTFAILLSSGLVSGSVSGSVFGLASGSALRAGAYRREPRQDIDRDYVRGHLKAAGIETAMAGFALNRLNSMRGVTPGRFPGRFPVAEAMHDRGLALPLYVGMRSAQLDKVCDTLYEVLT